MVLMRILRSILNNEYQYTALRGWMDPPKARNTPKEMNIADSVLLSQYIRDTSTVIGKACHVL